MGKRFKKLSFVVSLVLVFSFIFSSLSFAVEQIEDLQKEEYENQVIEEDQKIYSTIKEVEKYVVRNDDGTFAIKGDPDIDKESSALEKDMEEINGLIKEGILETDENLRVYANSKYVLQGNTTENKSEYLEYDAFFVQEETGKTSFNLGDKKISIGFNENSASAACSNPKPAQGLYYYWWGVMLSLSNETTQKLVWTLRTGGGSVGSMITLLAAAGIITSPAAVPSGVITALLVLSAYAIEMVNKWGGDNGVYFKALWGFPVWNMGWMWYRKC